MPGPTLREGRSGRARDDRGKIYLGKVARAVAYGALSGFLFLYLTDDIGLSGFGALVLTAFTLVGAAAWSLLGVSPLEARLGRRGAIRVFCLLFVLSAAILFLVAVPAAILAAALLGGVAAASADNGPLASLDTAILPSTLRRSDRAEAFAWYNLLAYFASAGGALLLVVPGALSPRAIPFLPAAPHPWILLLYLLLAGMTAFAYWDLSPAVESEAGTGAASEPLSPMSRRHVRDMAILFGVDAFAGGLVINPLIAAYFVYAWNADAAQIGLILAITGAIAGVSFLASSRLARRFGLLNTMVFSHLPSNILLALVPLMPTFGLALGVLAARSSLSQMDVPTRQAYTMSLVSARERTAAAGTLSASRGFAQSIAPFPASAFEVGGYLALPFILAGAMKVAYDLLVYRRFRSVPLPDEPVDPTSSPSAPPR
ncbi:MAG TPA: MFS transporter [Thermoplasmata archaeon]|nr:MFS transporter [Thermoplasmata archaeon]